MEKVRFEKRYQVNDPLELSPFVPDIIDCITEAFGHEMPEDEVRSAMKGNFIIVALNENNKTVGFSSIDKVKIKDLKNADPSTSQYYSEATGYHFGAGVVSRSVHHQGLYKEMCLMRLSEALANNSSFIVTTTQNPSVERGLISSLEEAVFCGLIDSYVITKYYLPGHFKRRLSAYDIDTHNTSFEYLNLDEGDAFFIFINLFTQKNVPPVDKQENL